MGLVDENTVKKAFDDLFDSPTSDEIIRECESLHGFLVGRIYTDRSTMMSQGVQLCNTFAKLPEDLGFKWQSICINMRSSQGSLEPMDMAGITLLRRELQKEVQQNAKKVGAAGPRRSQARLQSRQSLPQAVRQPVVSLKRPITIHDDLKERHCQFLTTSLASAQLLHRSLYARKAGRKIDWYVATTVMLLQHNFPIQYWTTRLTNLRNLSENTTA